MRALVNGGGRSLLVVLVVLLFLLGSPAAGALDSVRLCTELAGKMIEGTTRAASAGARGYGLGNAVIDWESDRGHRGTCRIDGEGRVYEVKVTAFPHWDNPTWESSYSVTCESKKNRRTECALRGAGEVRVERRLSDASCTEGRSWGVVGSKIWVDKGCRARFAVSPLPSWSPYTMRCESTRDRRQECSSRSDARVRLLRQESRSECREGWSWGQVGSTLWVDHGCRGLFEVSPLASSGGDDLTRRAISSCRSKVEQQGFTYRRTGTVKNVGRHIEVDVSAGRGLVEINLRCRFDPVFGTVDLASY